jgi:hypothetical protein
MEALKQYTESGAEDYMPFKLFLTTILGYTDEEAEIIEQAREAYLNDQARTEQNGQPNPEEEEEFTQEENELDE